MNQWNMEAKKGNALLNCFIEVKIREVVIPEQGTGQLSLVWLLSKKGLVNWSESKDLNHNGKWYGHYEIVRETSEPLKSGVAIQTFSSNLVIPLGTRLAMF